MGRYFLLIVLCIQLGYRFVETLMGAMLLAITFGVYPWSDWLSPRPKHHFENYVPYMDMPKDGTQTQAIKCATWTHS